MKVANVPIEVVFAWSKYDPDRSNSSRNRIPFECRLCAAPRVDCRARLAGLGSTDRAGLWRWQAGHLAGRSPSSKATRGVAGTLVRVARTCGGRLSVNRGRLDEGVT